MSEDLNKGRQTEIIINDRVYKYLDKGATNVDKGYLTRGWNYVVDWEHSPYLQEKYLELKTKLQSGKVNNEDEILFILFMEIGGIFQKKSVSETRSLAYTTQELKGKEPLSLEDFAKAGTGICAQTALTTALYGQRLKGDGLIKGDITFDEQYWDTELAAGGHIWGKYKSESGEETVIDIVRGFIGNRHDYEEILKEVEWEVLSNY